MKRKIYLITVWLMVIVLLPLSVRANVYTEKRSLFTGGYFEYLNTTLNMVDETYENKAKIAYKKNNMANEATVRATSTQVGW